MDLRQNFMKLSVRCTKRHLTSSPAASLGWHSDLPLKLDLLAFFEKPATAKLVREVAVALIGGRHVNLPCAGGRLCQ